MYFPGLVWHNILEFRHGERPFGFWNWKSSVNNVLKQIKKEYYPCYYWASYTKHSFNQYSGKIECIYRISTYGQNQWEPVQTFKKGKHISYIFKDRKYFKEFTRTLIMGRSI
tara:strand:+ start:1117 stop:1452 length:336 start_codon:yes stop_codon:yes gene_type:complete